jgi:hypothetical protein
MKQLLLSGAMLGVLLSALGCGNDQHAPCTPFTCQASVPTTTTSALLTVILMPTNEGTVTVSAQNQTPVTCSANCTLPISSGTGPITLAAAATLGDSFVGWVGCANPSGMQCTIATLSADDTVTANFQ